MPHLILICSKFVWRQQDWIINWTPMSKHSQEDEHICYDLECIAYSEHTVSFVLNRNTLDAPDAVADSEHYSSVQNLLQRPMRPMCSYY